MGEPRSRVAESFADDLDRHAGLEQQRGVGVSQVMEAESWETGSAHEFLERVREQLWVGRLPVRSGEHVPVGIAAVELRVLMLMTLTPRVENLDGSRIEVDRSPDGAGLPARLMQLIADGHERAGDGEMRDVEVDVAPP